MQEVIFWLSWAVESGPQLITALVTVLISLIAFFMLIPGDQPEKALQGAVDFLKKFSLKKED